jgi:hypothetical protein
VVTGNFLMAPGPGKEELVTVWKNLGRKP